MSYPDSDFIDRLEGAGREVVWAAGRLESRPHEGVDDLWPAHQQIAHLLAVETENFQPRIWRILAEERPALVSWDSDAFNEGYRPEGDLGELAGRFEHERGVTAALFRSVVDDQWRRTGTWPDGTEIDLAWLAEKVLWHSLDHLASLLDLHGEFEPRQGGA